MEDNKTCHNCEEIFDFSVEGGGDRDGNPLCDSCYHDATDTCACCEEHFFDPQTPEETFFIVAPSEKAYATPGVYRVLEFPFKYGDLISGFDGFFKEAIQRVADAPKNWKGEDYGSGFICQTCFCKYGTSEALAPLQ